MKNKCVNWDDKKNICKELDSECMNCMLYEEKVDTLEDITIEAPLY
jgi:hypothetical protein